MLRRIALITAATAVLAAAPAAAQPEGTEWTEASLTTKDGEQLHVDVLRKEGATDADKTPVILVVSPYLGQAGPTAKHVVSNRFDDLFEGAEVFERGYSVVMVSTRGTGGSTGCLDILGPGEQEDVRASVEWAASQPWSTGKVGMYGKSYDANLGVAGAALRPPGLEAVVAQQIVPDRYRGSYNDRVRFVQSVLFPAGTYGAAAEQGWSVNSDEGYITNAVTHSADCQAHFAGHYDDNRDNAFWSARNLVKKAEGSTVPTFVTGGYLDSPTNIGGGTIDFFNALQGPKRMWLGWWDHVRGNDTVGDRLAMGREGWFDEVMRFYDEHLKGVEPAQHDPKIVAQSSDGEWHTEGQWPPADARTVSTALKPGTYKDDAGNKGSNDSSTGPGGQMVPGRAYTTGAGAWTFSAPLDEQTQIAGIPSATVDVAPVLPRTNLVVNLYDIAPDNKATMISRGARLVDAAGPAKVAMFPTDWTFEPGHRIGVLVSGSNAESYVHVPTMSDVAVRGGSIDLPVLPKPRKANTAGESNPKLEAFRSRAPFTVSQATIGKRTLKSFRVERATRRTAANKRRR